MASILRRHWRLGDWLHRGLGRIRWLARWLTRLLRRLLLLLGLCLRARCPLYARAGWLWLCLPRCLHWRLEPSCLPFLLLFATGVLDDDIRLRGEGGHSFGGLVAHGLSWR